MKKYVSWENGIDFGTKITLPLNSIFHDFFSRQFSYGVLCDPTSGLRARDNAEALQVFLLQKEPKKKKNLKINILKASIQDKPPQGNTWK